MKVTLRNKIKKAAKYLMKERTHMHSFTAIEIASRSFAEELNKCKPTEVVTEMAHMAVQLTEERSQGWPTRGGRRAAARW